MNKIKEPRQNLFLILLKEARVLSFSECQIAATMINLVVSAIFNSSDVVLRAVG